MSSKRNHKIRSRKTYKERIRLARMNLMGSLPYEVRLNMMRAQRARKQ